MRILYVEDEPSDAQLVERYVKLTPNQHVLVNDVSQAEAALENTPDLILVDVLINKTRDGFRFVKELRSQGYTQPIVAVTGLALAADIEQCYAAGCTEVLTKPYAINQLADLFTKNSG